MELKSKVKEEIKESLKIIKSNKLSRNLAIVSILGLSSLFILSSMWSSNLRKLQAVNKELNSSMENLKEDDASVASLIEENNELKSELKKVSSKNMVLEKDNEALNESGFLFDKGSKWIGTYTMNDGDKVNAELTVEEYSTVLKFEHLSSDGSIFNGSYYLSKDTVNEEFGYIKLVSSEWIDKPENYTMDNLYGTVNGNKFIGVVVDSEGKKIGNFELKKS